MFVLLTVAGCGAPWSRSATVDPGSARAAENPGRGQTASTATTDSGPAVRNESLQPYILQPGDVIEVLVWKNPDLSRTVVVRPDGQISLPLLNEVSAAGRTALELRDDLAQRLTEYVSLNEVSVIIEEVRSVAVSVLGEVRQPGRYPLPSRTTVLDALAMAGGLTEFASCSGITVIRYDGHHTIRLPFSYKKATSPEGMDENFLVHAGDIIVVP
jgi:polysaccharide export outer membrane protein